jgi:hypothetical protein
MDRIILSFLLTLLSVAIVIPIVACETTDPLSSPTMPLQTPPAIIPAIPPDAPASVPALKQGTVPSYLIDAHCHLVPSICNDGLCGIEQVISNMDKAGVAKTVLFSLRSSKSFSADVLEAYHKYPERIIPSRGDDNLNVSNPATLNLVRSDLDTSIFRGIGEISTRHGADNLLNIPPDNPFMLELWKLGAKYRIPVNVHCDNPQNWLPELERALEQCPDTTFIWAHTGPSNPIILKGMFDRHPNLNADLSSLNPIWGDIRGFPMHQLEKPEWISMLEAYPERFLFGTDAWTKELHRSYPAIVAWFRVNVFSKLSVKTTEYIAHGNAEKLYGITLSAGTEKK